MKELAIIGAGGHGKVIAEIAELNNWTVSFFDDNHIGKLADWKIRGNLSDLVQQKKKFSSVFVAIGNNKTRQKLSLALKSQGFNLPTLIHPKACVSKYSLIANACAIMANASVNPMAVIGEGSIINTNAVIEHDCSIAEYVHISPGAVLAGNVNIGSCSWIGLNSSIIEGLKVGSNVTVGAGSTIIRNILDDITVVGSPARIIKEKY